MLKRIGDAGARALGAAQRSGDEALQEGEPSTPGSPVQAGELCCLPMRQAVRAATQAVRAPLEALRRQRPAAAAAPAPAPAAPYRPALPVEILEAIAGHLDKKELAAFAQVNRTCAAVAGGRVEALSFKDAADLRTALRDLPEGPPPWFAAGGLRELTLREGSFSAADIEALPAWIRDAVRTVKLPLNADGADVAAAWAAVEQLPRLRAIQLSKPGGYAPDELQDPENLEASLRHHPAESFSGIALSMPELTLGLDFESPRLEAADLANLPPWARKSVRTLKVEQALADDAWPALAGFEALRELRYPLGAWQGYDSHDLARLPRQLERLELKAPLCEAAIDQLQQFPSLEQVDVQLENGASVDELLDHFHPPGRLAHVELRALSIPHVEDVPERTLQRLLQTRLRRLDMPLAGAPLRRMMAHPTLVEFSARNAGLDADDARVIAANERLRCVDVRSNLGIGDEGLQALLANRHLRELRIAGCSGSDALLAPLRARRPPHLHSLALDA